jgi:beta-glucosidase
VVDRNHPAIQLKGFYKIHLYPKESSIVEFHLSARAFSEWDGKKSAWAVVPGIHTIIIGTSSMDHRLSMDVEIKDSPDHGRNDPGTITI